MTKKPPPRRRPPKKSYTPLLIAGVIGAVVLLGFGLVIRGDKNSSKPAAGVVMTGEMNAMGMPVIKTTGAASGTAEAGGVQVTGSNWALGTVPLKVAVRPSWTLTNTSDQAVTLGDPTVNIRKGCCPGPFTLASHTLAPGESTTLTFELSMHPGMDGWHDMAVNVPVSTPMGPKMLTLNVTGDFHD